MHISFMFPNQAWSIHWPVPANFPFLSDLTKTGYSSFEMTVDVGGGGKVLTHVWKLWYSIILKQFVSCCEFETKKEYNITDSHMWWAEKENGGQAGGNVSQNLFQDRRGKQEFNSNFA